MWVNGHCGSMRKTSLRWPGIFIVMSTLRESGAGLRLGHGVWDACAEVAHGPVFLRGIEREATAVPVGCLCGTSFLERPWPPLSSVNRSRSPGTAVGLTRYSEPYVGYFGGPDTIAGHACRLPCSPDQIHTHAAACGDGQGTASSRRAPLRRRSDGPPVR
jgi:hypothetical protein